jgi:hypothetical protein
MKKLKKFNEATLMGNAGIPGETDKAQPSYNDIAKQKANKRFKLDEPDMKGKLISSIGTMEEVQKFTEGYEKELEQLAYDVMQEFYGTILDETILKITIETDMKKIGSFYHNVKSGRFSSDVERPFNPPFSVDESKEFKFKVDKAKIINNLIHGEGANVSKIFNSEMVKERLTSMFGADKAKKVIELWNKFHDAAFASFWAFDIESAAKAHSTLDTYGGAVKVTFDDTKSTELSEEDEEYFSALADTLNQGEGVSDEEFDFTEDDEESNDEEFSDDFGVSDEESEDEDFEEYNEQPTESTVKQTINVYAVNFPVAIHESVKGIYELLFLLSQQSSADEDPDTENVVTATSSHWDEAEDLRYGPIIASDFNDFVMANPDADSYPNIKEFVYGMIAALEPKDFLRLCKGILMNTAAARRKVDALIAEVIEGYKAMDLYDIDNPRDTNYSYNEEPEAQTQEEEAPKEVDYSKMGQSELQKMMNKFLDDENYPELDKISKYIRSDEKKKHLAKLIRLNESRHMSKKEALEYYRNLFAPKVISLIDSAPENKKKEIESAINIVNSVSYDGAIDKRNVGLDKAFASELQRAKNPDELIWLAQDFMHSDLDLYAEDETLSVRAEETEPDTNQGYASMSAKQLDNELNIALDAGDYAKAKEISNFIKESKRYRRK